MPLDDTEKALFEYLAAEFEACEQTSSSPEATCAKSIVARYKQSPETMTKGDVFELEMIILRLQPTERLVRRAKGLRLKYKDLAGVQLAAAYEETPLPPPDKYNDDEARRPLLAELQQVLSFLHWTYFFTPIRERIRRNIIHWAVLSMLGYTIGWAIVLYLLYQAGFGFVAVLVTVLYAGILGGFISSQRRMQMIPTEGDPLISIYELQSGRYFLWFSPLTGAVFAVVLMVLFIGNVLNGVVFPAFEMFPFSPPSQGAAPQPWYFLSHLLPKTSVDYGLLFVWSFIAGFAERFVPDALDRLTNRAKESATTAARSGSRTSPAPAPAAAAPTPPAPPPPPAVLPPG